VNDVDIAQAIHSLDASAEFSIREDIITWITDEIAQEDIQSELSRLQAEYDGLQYQRDRASEYPSFGDQLDMQYWDGINGTTTWADSIQAVKAKYPKDI
jgi:hypothetical protein